MLPNRKRTIPILKFSSCVTWSLFSDQLFGKSILTKDRVKNYTDLHGAASNHVSDYRGITVVMNEHQVNFPFKGKMFQSGWEQGCPGMRCGCRDSVELCLGPTSWSALHLSTGDSMDLCILGQ